jgi:hypothetical protein
LVVIPVGDLLLLFNPRQKYFSKRWKIFSSEKVSDKTPQITTNPPQLHHDLPSRNTTKTQKPLAKRQSTMPKNILPIQQKLVRLDLSYADLPLRSPPLHRHRGGAEPARNPSW